MNIVRDTQGHILCLSKDYEQVWIDGKAIGNIPLLQNLTIFRHCEERSNRNGWDCFVPRNDMLNFIISSKNKNWDAPKL
ncbi:hypothetical protein [Nostoc sp.]|uniref:hypothetical protein n=1 Tax=Nostoc sp. TaxID=1180 RepID=UPI002FF93BBA